KNVRARATLQTERRQMPGPAKGRATQSSELGFARGARRGIANGWLAALILVIASISSGRAFAEPLPGGRSWNAASGAARRSRQVPGADERLFLRVYNYVPIDPVILQRSEEIAAAIFEDSGVGISWVECTPRQGGLLPRPVCPSDMGTTDLVLR